jgi:hypothetical protein
MLAARCNNRDFGTSHRAARISGYRGFTTIESGFDRPFGPTRTEGWASIIGG